VTTTTISQQQYDYTKAKIHKEGLQDRIHLRFDDYRDLTGTKVSHLLKPDGMALIQAITIADQRYDSAIKSVDFIQRYIFPGSNIPSVTAMLNSITQHTDMRLFDLEDIGPDYATTLRMWRENFFAHIDRVKALGYSDAFIKMWEFYLCYCEGGFEERILGDVHLLLVKPQSRH